MANDNIDDYDVEAEFECARECTLRNQNSFGGARNSTSQKPKAGREVLWASVDKRNARTMQTSRLVPGDPSQDQQTEMKSAKRKKLAAIVDKSNGKRKRG